MDNELPFPNSQDKLFKEFNEDYRHNAVISAGIDKFFLFSQGYKIAAIKLYEQLDGEAFHANTLVYPLVFLNRQFLELRLKELISGLNFTLSHKYEFSNGHDLNHLWHTYKSLVQQLDKNNVPENELLQNTEKLIIEFNSIDPKSFSFRYPVDTTVNRNPSLKITNVDLLNFMTTMEKLYNFFDAQSDMIFYLIDMTEEFINIMRSEMESELQSYYENF